MIVILFTAQDHDEGALTAWTDSMVHAWDQVSFSDTESEDDGELYREMPRDVIRSSDLNRRLDHEALNRVNCYFERVFDLAGRPLTRQDAEEITANSQGDVIAILRNIISCQQQHTEGLYGTRQNFGEVATTKCIMNSDSFNSLCQVYWKWS